MVLLISQRTGVVLWALEEERTHQDYVQEFNIVSIRVHVHVHVHNYNLCSSTGNLRSGFVVTIWTAGSPSPAVFEESTEHLYVTPGPNPD